MVQITKKLKCKWIGGSEYQPREITPTEWYRVIGVNSWEYEKEENGKKKHFPVVRLMVVNNKGKVSSMSIDNLSVIIDEKAQS